MWPPVAAAATGKSRRLAHSLAICTQLDLRGEPLQLCGASGSRSSCWHDGGRGGGGTRGNARIGFENGSADVEMWEYSCHDEGDSEWTQIGPSEEEVLVGSLQVCSPWCMISLKSSAPIHFSTQCQCNGYNRFLPVLVLWLSLCEGLDPCGFFQGWSRCSWVIKRSLWLVFGTEIHTKWK